MQIVNLFEPKPAYDDRRIVITKNRIFEERFSPPYGWSYVFGVPIDVFNNPAILAAIRKEVEG